MEVRAKDFQRLKGENEYVLQTIDLVKELGFNESKINNNGRCTHSK